MGDNSKFNLALLDKIQTLLPSKQEQLKLVTQTISIGKEAAYRRLRGEVLFSFEEACKIASKMGISLDSLLNVSARNDNPVFHLALFPPDTLDNYVKYFYSHMLSVHEEFEKYYADPNLVTMAVFSSIPHSMYFPYPNLFRFRAFHWIYQYSNSNIPLTFSEIVVPDEIESRFKELGVDLTTQNEQVMIFDHHIFYSLCNQIKYFYELNLISKEEKCTLAEELFKMISELEMLASYGKSKMEKTIWIYLSYLSFDMNYTYVKGSTFEYSYLDIYLLNSLTSSDPLICKTHKRWIESYRKYSTLISAGGEKERRKFFDLQKKYVDELFG